MGKNIFNKKGNSGFTLFVALATAGTLLLVAAGVTSLALKQSHITSAGKMSQIAFYAADSGVECALYWDVKNPAGSSAFATSTTSTINCNRDAQNLANQWVVGGADVSTFTINFLPDPFCALVRISKDPTGRTTIESFGYNSCDVTNPRRVERAVRAIY